MVSDDERVEVWRDMFLDTFVVYYSPVTLVSLTRDLVSRPLKVVILRLRSGTTNTTFLLRVVFYPFSSVCRFLVSRNETHV